MNAEATRKAQPESVWHRAVTREKLWEAIEAARDFERLSRGRFDSELFATARERLVYLLAQLPKR